MKRLVSCLVVLCLCVSVGFAEGPRWERLGKRSVNYAGDRDEIRVTAREGTFRQIKLVVRHNAVVFRDVKVHFANGDVQDIPLRRTVPAGGETRVIDLAGSKRVVEKVVFWYKTKRMRRRKAVVELWGRH